jgi:hypothetical protein
MAGFSAELLGCRHRAGDSPGIRVPGDRTMFAIADVRGLTVGFPVAQHLRDLLVRLSPTTRLPPDAW